ncbi:pullulanase [Bacillus sp. APMAM]|nr:pullulanase [Bacillus sp. APMAM]RTZ57643.1 pullulanase [Bacillus sp. SAJ1]
MDITGHTVEQLEDPTGILTGDRYEFILNIEVPEDDELYSENGLYIKAIYVDEGNQSRVAQYHIFEKVTDRYLEFELEEDEEKLLKDFCREHISDM